MRVLLLLLCLLLSTTCAVAAAQVPDPAQPSGDVRPVPDPTILTLGAYQVVALQRKYLQGVSRLVVSGVTVG